MAVADCFLVGLALTASMLLVTGVFLPGWSEEAMFRPGKGIVINYKGFWEECDYRAGVLQLTDNFDFLRATEVLTSLGLFLLFVACLVFATYECVSGRRRQVRVVMGVAALTSALFVLPGAIIFAVQIKSGFDVCFGLSLTSALLAIIAAILAFTARSKPGEAP